MKPSKGILEVLNRIYVEDGVLARIKGGLGPFTAMRSKTGEIIHLTKIPAEEVLGLYLDQWLKVTGNNTTVEAYALTDVGIARLKEPQKKPSVPRGRLRRLQFQKGPDLDVDAIKAWQRFQESYELACIEDQRFRDWDGELTYGDYKSWGPFNGRTDDGTYAGALRDAVTFLGSDLTNALLHFFCLGKGLEDMERKLNWPARSGKVVLAIAARRLVSYYN